MSITHAQPQWYQQGSWPLVGVVLALFLTQGITVGLAVYASTASLRREFLLRRMSVYREQLTGFYNPLLSLLLANRAVFDEFGPKTFPTNEIERETAATVWTTLKAEVIIPNNEGILTLLREKCHLVSEVDDIENYSRLINHIVLYKIFMRYKTEHYKAHLFPSEIVEHVRKHSGIVKVNADTLTRKA